MKQLILCRSLPGGGKSTLAKQYKDMYYDSCFICSTDDYWVRPDETYDFNHKLLGKAHAWNQNLVENIIKSEKDSVYDTVVVIDNTNITFNEMKPYIESALKYYYDIMFIEPDTEWRHDVDECFKRNTHGVPFDTILNMSRKWEDHDTVLSKLKAFKICYLNSYLLQS